MSSDIAISAQTLQEHLAYHAWASLRLLDAAAKLTPTELTQDFRTATNNILGTLVHIFAADRAWIGRLKNAPPLQFVAESDHDFSTLAEKWNSVHAEWQKWAAELTDPEAQTMFTYRDLKGTSWSQPIWQIVLHAVNHGSHHRGQISGFVRALGQTPPPLDLIVYYRQQSRS